MRDGKIIEDRHLDNDMRQRMIDPVHSEFDSSPSASA